MSNRTNLKMLAAFLVCVTAVVVMAEMTRHGWLIAPPLVALPIAIGLNIALFGFFGNLK